MAIDLDDLERADTARVQFTHPVTGVETGWFITLYGPGSEEHEAAAESMRQRKLKMVRRHKKVDEIPNEANFASFCEFLADVTAKLEVTRGGQPVESNRKAVIEFFRNKQKYGPEFAAQAAEALGDLGNFTKG